MSEWKPISTAPRDGTSILIWDAESLEMFIAYWNESADPEPAFWVARCDMQSIFEPTHWMPLPNRPR
jgi:hypothetical protein